jgi:spore coat protein A
VDHHIRLAAEGVKQLSRRDLLRAGLSSAIFLLGGRAFAGDNPWADALAAYGTVRPPSFQLPLPIPRTLEPVRGDGSDDIFELTVKPGLAQPLPGAPTPIWGFEGTWPGPTLRARRGRLARVRVKNALTENISVHNHGHAAAHDSDGHPIDYVRPGMGKEYLYPNQQSGGTYWIHDHAFGLTGAHVYRGMAAFYLIDDPEEAALGLPSGDADVPIVLQDRLFEADNTLRYTVDAGTIFTGFLGNTLCANGVHTPVLDVGTRRYRLRVLNGCNARNLKLALEDGAPLAQIGSDGSLLAAPVIRTAIDLAPSERADLVIDFSRYTPGAKIVLKNLDPTWPSLPDVLRFDVKRRERDPSRLPDRLTTLSRLDPALVRVHRRVVLGLADGKWTMNGLRYDPGRVDFRPRLGTTEIWEIKNSEPTQMHPFHQHLVPFQVLDINGAPPPPALAGWKDTVAIPPSASVRLIMRFQGPPGVYVFHCHKLEHEDHAMMLQEEVG